ncbi:organomercurial lyase [Bdellovibrionota bacterium FG-2]
MNILEISKILITFFPKDPLEKHLLLSVVNWLAEGKALPLIDISRHLGYSLEKLIELLNALPKVEFDSTGNLVSIAGMSLYETPYPMDSEKCRLYAQSGLDAVVVPILLLTKMGVSHRAPGAPLSVCLRFGFDQAFTLQPEQTVISFPSRKLTLDHLRASPSEFHLFPNPDTARRWLWQHPEGIILSVRNVFTAAVNLRESLMGSNAWMPTP